MPRHAQLPSSIPDCREEGCDRKVVTIESSADYEEYRLPEYSFPGCAFVPPQPHETGKILMGHRVTEICSNGHEMSYYRYPDGTETEAYGSGVFHYEFRKESA